MKRHRDVALSALLSSVSPALTSLEAFSTNDCISRFTISKYYGSWISFPGIAG
jgi:hypothetical protein